MRVIYRKLILAAMYLSLIGCAPLHFPDTAIHNQPAILRETFFSTKDGSYLPLRRWLPEAPPTAVLIALHGFNDYSRFFELPGNYFKAQGIACFAYDQRGFGAAPKRGRWAGSEVYGDDLFTLIELLTRRYPGAPIYVLGESMGGAIVIDALSRQRAAVAGIILAAPALWARSTMPWYQTSLLWTLAHTMPGLTLTGESVQILPSDNIQMLREMGKDPLIIKGTRVDAIYGLTDLMDAAFNSATSLNIKSLLLYGEKDQVIPKKPTYTFIRQWQAQAPSQKTVAIYPQGYHMLLRDLQAPTAWRDIVAWMNNKALPSQADQRAAQLVKADQRR